MRIPINHRLFEDGDGAAVDVRSGGWGLLDSILGWCEQHRVYAILDLHAAPGGQSTLFTADPDPGEPLWGSATRLEQTAALWKAIAGRYADRAALAAYDLLNEPTPPTGQELVAAYKVIIDAIRSVDPNHLIILEGADLARDFSAFEEPLADNLMYSFHIYSTGDKRQRQLAGYVEAARAHNVPLWAGEVLSGQLQRHGEYDGFA